MLKIKGTITPFAECTAANKLLRDLKKCPLCNFDDSGELCVPGDCEFYKDIKKNKATTPQQAQLMNKYKYLITFKNGTQTRFYTNADLFENTYNDFWRKAQDGGLLFLNNEIIINMNDVLFIRKFDYSEVENG